MSETLFDVDPPDPQPPPLRGMIPAAPIATASPHTEATMLERLRLRYSVTSQGTGRRFVFATHVRDGAGFDRRTADAVALDLWQSSRHPLLGFEVKVSRSDWLRELRDPHKHTAVARYCSQWWLVVPDLAMVRREELPSEWGLLVCSGAGLRAARAAPTRRPEEPPRGFWAAFTRAAVRTEGKRHGVRGPW